MVDKTVASVKRGCRTVRVKLKTQVKEKLDRMVEQGIIAKVVEPTDWASAFVVAPKKSRVTCTFVWLHRT